METKFCVVCGQGSTRTDWINKSGDYVACDNHTAAQVAQAVSKATAPPAPTAKPGAPATPPKMASIPKAN